MACIICLESDENLKSLTETDSKNVTIEIKLRKCVPEVEWNSNTKICSICLQQLENACAFREQCILSFRKHTTCKNEEFVCFHCEEKFPQKPILQRHILRKHTKPNKICDACGKILSCEATLKRHKTICLKKVKTEDICSICGTLFSNKYLLKRHVKNVHATEKNFKCEECDRRFASPVYLNAHKRYHSGERRHICSFCGKGYITASDLYHHEKIHANKRAYRCPICPKAFNTSSDLHKHKICVHLARALWKHVCSYCERRFPLKTNLDTHLKIHTGERNFPCTLCDKKCINRSVLKRHLQTHSPSKNFQCSICFQLYKSRKSLDNHLGKKHV